MFVDPQPSSESSFSEESLKPQNAIRLSEDIEAVKKVSVRLYDYHELYDQYEFFVYGDSDTVERNSQCLRQNNCIRQTPSDASIDDLEALILTGNALALTVKISYFDYNEPCGTSEYHVLGTEKAVKNHVNSLYSNNCVRYTIRDTATGEPYQAA